MENCQIGVIMEFKITLKDVFLFLIVAALFVYCVFQFASLKSEVKYQANFTAIVNQINTNTNDIKAIAQAVQVVQKKVGITTEGKN